MPDSYYRCLCVFAAVDTALLASSVEVLVDNMTRYWLLTHNSGR